MARRRQERRLVLRLLLPLDLDGAHQQARRRGRDRHPTRLGAAGAVEDRVVVGGAQDAFERRQGRAHDVDPRSTSSGVPSG
jgi:hypothetical protein